MCTSGIRFCASARARTLFAPRHDQCSDVVTPCCSRTAAAAPAPCGSRATALDVDVDDVDWLGRPIKLPNIMDGDGLDEDEYAIMKAKGVEMTTKIPPNELKTPQKASLKSARKITNSL